MGFIETVGATVAAALIVGLTVLAVRKPRQYRRLQPFLFAMVGLVWMLTTAYAIGGEMTEGALVPLVEAGKLGVAYKAADAVQPSIITGIIVGAATGAFLGVLSSLPALLGISDDGDDQDDGKEKP